ncbi:MAG TPA: HlyD family efflux transporter periplasmic adaptor subunit [Steroidobacteraceae bacterium]|nr:HlyD family efflux transporter periplasmic adaptor subunit [Steroidobacteraceae bacterium]
MLAGIAAWWVLRPSAAAQELVSGNGRIEATEVNVSTKLGGRVEDILVEEGAFVKAKQPLALMQTDTLQAQRNEAQASQRQAVTSVAMARAQVDMRKSELASAEADIVRAESDLDAAQRRLARSETLSKEGASSIQELDDDRARVRAAGAALSATKARAVAARTAIDAARTQVAGAEAAVAAAAATVARIEADIQDSMLVSPRDGRVQYRIVEPGEVLSPGAPVLNLVDVSDVHMTFFLPEAAAGRVALGSDVRVVLDAAPSYVIPAKVTFVASTAQFTPKTVETASERQKLMFRVKARIDRDLLRKHLSEVKTGLPGVAWIKLDPAAAWPSNLAVKVPE